MIHGLQGFHSHHWYLCALGATGQKIYFFNPMYVECNWLSLLSLTACSNFEPTVHYTLKYGYASSGPVAWLLLWLFHCKAFVKILNDIWKSKSNWLHNVLSFLSWRRHSLYALFIHTIFWYGTHTSKIYLNCQVNYPTCRLLLIYEVNKNQEAWWVLNLKPWRM